VAVAGDSGCCCGGGGYGAGAGEGHATGGGVGVGGGSGGCASASSGDGGDTQPVGATVPGRWGLQRLAEIFFCFRKFSLLRASQDSRHTFAKKV
jgi:hypothetical protein